MLRSWSLLVFAGAAGCAGVRAAPTLSNGETSASTAPMVSGRSPGVVRPRLGGGARIGDEIVSHAASLVGRRSIRGLAGGVSDDCSGFVRYSYQAFGIDLVGAHPRAGDSGVSAIYRHAQSIGAMHRRIPKPGDLVFFRDTYDRNGDGRRNDGLTHIGLVRSVDADGTIWIVHRANSGVRMSAMNLGHPHWVKDPSGKRVNDYIRKASARNRAYLTAELFSGFASVDRLSGRSTLLAARR